MDIDSPDVGRLVGGAHLFPVRVYYEDTDFTGVVYHAQYLHFFERGRTEWLRMLGVSHRQLGEGRFGEAMAFAVNRLAIDYKRPARVDDILQVRTSLIEARGARLVLKQEMARPADDAAIAVADLEVVLINKAGAPRRLPAEVVELLEGS